MLDIYPYNDDLLAGKGDQDRARMEYPDIAFALIFPEMLEVFARAEAEANRSKRAIRHRGFISIGLVTISLIMASAAPLLEHLIKPWPAVIAVVAAVFGVFGAAIASLTRSRPWLEARLVTESLRQWHFRLLIELAPDLLQAAATQQTDLYENKRRIALGSVDIDFNHSMVEMSATKAI